MWEGSTLGHGLKFLWGGELDSLVHGGPGAKAYLLSLYAGIVLVSPRQTLQQYLMSYLHLLKSSYIILECDAIFSDEIAR